MLKKLRVIAKRLLIRFLLLVQILFALNMFALSEIFLKNEFAINIIVDIFGLDQITVFAQTDILVPQKGFKYKSQFKNHSLIFKLET
jgi:hypothetical protein